MNGAGLMGNMDDGTCLVQVFVSDINISLLDDRT